MRNTLPFIISYILSGGLLLAFFLNREKYESARKFRSLAGQLAALLLLVVAAAFIVVSCYHVTELTACMRGGSRYSLSVRPCAFLSARLLLNSITRQSDTASGGGTSNMPSRVCPVEWPCSSWLMCFCSHTAEFLPVRPSHSPIHISHCLSPCC